MKKYVISRTGAPRVKNWKPHKKIVCILKFLFEHYSWIFLSPEILFKALGYPTFYKTPLTLQNLHRVQKSQQGHNDCNLGFIFSICNRSHVIIIRVKFSGSIVSFYHFSKFPIFDSDKNDYCNHSTIMWSFNSSYFP